MAKHLHGDFTYGNKREKQSWERLILFKIGKGKSYVEEIFCKTADIEC
jgi:hypothetical protein